MAVKPRTLPRNLRLSIAYRRHRRRTNYSVARWADVPEVEVVLLNHPEVAPSGAGEPSSRATEAAIDNAALDATGVRIRRAPLTPARVKAELA